MDKNIINFAWMIVSGIEVLGMISDDSYSGWLVGNSKIVVYQPRFITRELEQPSTIQTPNARPRVLVKIAPVTALATSQERISVNPFVVEILAKLEGDDDSVTCSPYSSVGDIVSLYNDYTKALRSWKAGMLSRFNQDVDQSDTNSDVIDMFKGKH